MPPRYHDTVTPWFQEVEVENIRKAVKQFDKEPATHCFTDSEKKAITKTIYKYYAQGIRTTENQITRIAINFILMDYKKNGQKSVLEVVLQALNE